MMHLSKKQLLLFILFFVSLKSAVSQLESEVDNIQGQEIFLITDYEKFNKILGGDSVRYCNDRPCNEWIRDLYPCGALKHRGYYLDGQLTSVYKNFYEDGQTEREFNVKSHRKSIMKIYYPTGNLLSEITYDYAEPVSWKDYYPDGQIEYDEKYHKSKEFILHRIFYYPNGQVESSIRLINKRKLLYERASYFENGRVKEKGFLNFNSSMRDYQRTGKWQFFDENGQLILEETYYKNRVIDDSEPIDNYDDDDSE